MIFEEWYTETTGEPAYYVYVMYDSSGYCLYVGITNNLRDRMHAHFTEKPWIQEVANVSLHEEPSRESARKLEKGLIQNLGPVYNIQNNAHGLNVVSYLKAKYEAAGCAGVMAGIQAIEEEDRPF